MNYALTIIVPVYNEQDNLQRLEKELLKYLDIAAKPACVLLVNDGSTDGSLAICEKDAEKDSRIVLITQKNAGLSAARNHGIKIAKGEFIAFLDSDDLWYPEKLEKQFPKEEL